MNLLEARIGNSVNIKDRATAVIRKGIQIAKPIVEETHGLLEHSRFVRYDRHASRKWQKGIANFVDQLLKDKPQGTQLSLLYPFAATDLSSALAFNPDILVTLDLRSPFTATYKKDDTRDLIRYLRNKLPRGMIYNRTPINYLTWCAESYLAGIVPETVQLTDIYFLPTAQSKDQAEVTVWNYLLTSGKTTHHINVSGADLYDVHSRAFYNLAGHLYTLLSDTHVIGLDKASKRGAIPFIRSVATQGTLVTDQRWSVATLQELSSTAQRQNLQRSWDMLREGYNISSLNWGYADSANDIGVFQF